VFDPSNNPAPPSAFTVRAGISNAATPAAGDAEQSRGVSSFRVHPGYTLNRALSSDDVAILALTAPLDLSGPAVQAVTLPSAGGSFPDGVTVGFAGFGRQIQTASSDGSLNWLTPTIEPQGTCSGAPSTVVPSAAAVAFCGSTTIGAICNGDSGGGLVTLGTPRTLVGVASATTSSCAPGAHGIYTYVAAPEILDFIQGNYSPPVAPRESEVTFVSLAWAGSLQVGNTVACRSGGWDGAAEFTYVFTNAQTGEVLQQGTRQTYVLTGSDLGAQIVCRVLAANDGGMAVLSSDPSQPVAAAPQIAIAPVTPVKAARGRSARVVVVLRVPHGVTGKIGVCVTPPASIGNRICASESGTGDSYGRVPFTLGVRIKPTAPIGRSKLSITAVAGVARAQSSAFVRVSRT